MSRALISSAILVVLASATGSQNGEKLQAARHTFKAGKHVVHYFGEDELKEKTDHRMLFGGLVLKSLVDPALAKKEKSDFVAISHREVLKLTQEQKVHVEKKRMEKAVEKSSEIRKPLEKSHSHLLANEGIYYYQPGEYIEFSFCGNNTDAYHKFGTEVGKCFRCENTVTKEVRGCKASYDYMSQMVNFTSYESLTCEDAHYWMDRETNTFPAYQCMHDYYKFDILNWDTSYAYPTEGFTQAFYNDSSCDEAPIYYQKVAPEMSTDNGESCYAEGEVSFGITKGCEYYNRYPNDDCSGPPHVSVPFKQKINTCVVEDEEKRKPFMGLFDQSHEVLMDEDVRAAYFCGNGYPDGSNAVCMTEDGSPCEDIFRSGMEGFVAIPSPTTRVCKPHDNDDRLKVEFLHLARNDNTSHGVGKVTIKTPDDVSPTDRFRIVMKIFGDGKKESFASFKFNGRPENHTLTFQWEGLFTPSFEPREGTVKIKQRVYDEDRNFTRKSCVRFNFPHDEEEEDEDEEEDYTK